MCLNVEKIVSEYHLVLIVGGGAKGLATAAAAHKQAPIVVENLIAVIEGREWLAAPLERPKA